MMPRKSRINLNTQLSPIEMVCCPIHVNNPRLLLRLILLSVVVATAAVTGFTTTNNKARLSAATPASSSRLSIIASKLQLSATRSVQATAATDEVSSTEPHRQRNQENERKDDDAYTPYRGEQPKEASSEIFIPQIFHHDPTSFSSSSSSSLIAASDDESLWVPQTEIGRAHV